MKIKIGIKILLSFLFVIILMTFLSFYLINSNYNSLQQSVGDLSILLVQQMMERIDQNIYLKIEEMQLYFKNLIQINCVQQLFVLMNSEEMRTQYQEISVNNQEMINPKVSALLKKNLIDYYKQQYNYELFTEVFITDAAGMNIAQTGPTTDMIQNDEEWWSLAKERYLYVSDVEYDESADTYGISICIRIDDENGAFLGISKTILSLKGIIMETELNIKKYKNFEATLVTKDSKIIYSTNAFHYLADISGEKFYQQADKRQGSFILNHNGITKLFTHTSSTGYRTYKGHQWELIIAQDLKDVFQPVFTLIMSMIAVSLFIIILGIIISYILSRSISRPIEQFIKAAQIIGNGNLDYKVEIFTGDEINELAKEFNQMTERLKKTISDITFAEKKIERSLKEKEILLQEIHHRVKNNLQVIMSMLRLQTKSTKENGLAEKINEIQNRIKSISLIHEQLYQSENFINIDFTLYIRSIINNLFRFYKTDPARIQLTFDIDSLILGIDQAIPCGLIMNELISNSLKHAFPGDKKGQISVSLHSKEENKIELTISNNGIPIENDLDYYKNSETLGLYLVIILAEDQLNGTITLDRTNGNKFIISFTRQH
ncbi:MAG: HAMP domain-containing protein [Spirochaetales bacterium]|nr:HAMP domain-containing protein [Spirochaetales bacterium]